jgi:hypothetical protein
MSYSPNNVSVYLNAFAGAIAGLGAFQRYLNDPVPADYAASARMADALAQEVDIAWGSSVPTSLELSIIENACEVVWADRSPLENAVAFTPANYTSLAAGIVALALEGNAIVVAEGISPNAPSPGAVPYAQFFALMPGDNSATIAAGAPILFPQLGPTSGAGAPTALSSSTFNLPTAGTYEVNWQASVAEAGQLQLAIGGVGLPNTVVGRATGTNQINGSTIIKTTLPNQVLSVINPAGNSPALTMTVSAGGTHSVSATLSIKQLS